MFDYLIPSIEVWMGIRMATAYTSDENRGVFSASLKLKLILLSCVLAAYSSYYSFITRNNIGMPKAWMKSRWELPSMRGTQN